jgi:hypothetical protein
LTKGTPFSTKGTPFSGIFNTCKLQFTSYINL